jgi:hypothetical protein
MAWMRMIWPQGWYKQPLTEFTVSPIGGGRRGRVIWDFAATDVEVVGWGAKVRKNNSKGTWKLSPKQEDALRVAISALESTLSRTSPAQREAGQRRRPHGGRQQ